MSAKGFTLVELVISITLISIAFIGIILAVNTVTRFSANPMTLYQGIAIAESYLEEISSKAFPTTVPCPAPPAGGRAAYNNVCDYSGLNQSPTDILGNPIAALAPYNVQVTVDTSGATLPNLTSGTNVVRIDVRVARSNMPTMIYSVYRTNY